MRNLSLFAFLSISAVGVAQTPYERAQQTLRSAPLESVLELQAFVPKSPTAFSANGQTLVCYELLLTNNESIPFRVERVDIYAEGTSSALYEQKRTELSHLLNHPGWKEAKGKPRDAQLIVGGEQVIDFLWMVVPSGSPPPKTLLHTITLRRINTQASTTLPIGSVDVIGQAVMIDPPLRGGSWLL